MCNGTFLKNHRLVNAGLVAEMTVYTVLYSSPAGKALSVGSSIVGRNWIRALDFFMIQSESKRILGLLHSSIRFDHNFRVFIGTKTLEIICLLAFQQRLPIYGACVYRLWQRSLTYAESVNKKLKSCAQVLFFGKTLKLPIRISPGLKSSFPFLHDLIKYIKMWLICIEYLLIN